MPPYKFSLLTSSRTSLSSFRCPRSIVSVAQCKRKSPPSRRYSSASSPPTKHSSRWLEDTRTRLGKCISFGLRDPSHIQTATNIARVLGTEWRGLVAGPLGFNVAASPDLPSGESSSTSSALDALSSLSFSSPSQGSSLPSSQPNPPPSSQSNPPSQTTTDVRWGDQDPMAHVNNTVYLRYAEVSRLAYFNHLRTVSSSLHGPSVVSNWPGDMSTSGYGFILANITCEYLLPLKYPDRVTVVHAVEEWDGKAGVTFRCLVLSHKHQRVAARVREMLPLYDYQKQKKIGVPAWLEDVLGQERQGQMRAKEYWESVRGNVEGWIGGLEAETVNSGRAEDLGR